MKTPLLNRISRIAWEGARADSVETFECSRYKMEKGTSLNRELSDSFLLAVGQHC